MKFKTVKIGGVIMVSLVAAEPAVELAEAIEGVKNLQFNDEVLAVPPARTIPDGHSHRESHEPNPYSRAFEMTASGVSSMTTSPRSYRDANGHVWVADFPAFVIAADKKK